MAGVASIGCMTADGQGFHQRELLVGKILRGMEFVGPDKGAFAKATVHHDPKDLEVFAAVSLPLGAGPTGNASPVLRRPKRQEGRPGEEFRNSDKPDPCCNAQEPRAPCPGEPGIGWIKESRDVEGG